MVLKYPIVLLLVSIAVLVAALVVRKARPSSKAGYAGGAKAANTARAKALGPYVSAMRARKVATTVLLVLCSAALALSAVLVARPVSIQEAHSIKDRKDIMLCLDV
ncbi:MAG: hypothetical protein BZ138_06190, partial [Methanosphaera sp. rholeuAM270]